MRVLMQVFTAGGFIPHGHCYLWKPGLVWLHGVSDGLIAIAYYFIPLALIYFVHKRQDLPFNWIFLLFSSFIVACGTTHLLEVWTLWHPTYWLSGTIKAITASVSLYTAICLTSLLPKALNFPGLAAINQDLEREIGDRKQAEAALQIEKNNLELRVAERTAELLQVNQRLQSELEERKRIQAALEISQARFAGILDIAEDAIISIDRNQHIALFNQGAERIFGYSAAEVIGKPLDILLPVGAAQMHRQHVAEFGQSAVRSRRMGERREIFGRHKDGSQFPAEASISKLNLNKEVSFTVFLQDITDRKQIDRMKDEFVSVVSHELRTPLTSIHGSLGMLASGLLKADSDQGKRMLHIAVDSTDRLVRLINDILDIERIESGKVQMEKQCCDVDDLTTEAVNVVQALADKGGVSLSVSSSSVSLWADPDRIVQTLTNLLSNAIKFSPTGNTVWLTVQHQHEQVLFAVKDQGRGIPTDKLESIFERFQQVDSSDSRNHEGTGLGLAICRSIVQQHDGQIWVESVLGEGSTFYFTLPIRVCG